MAATEALRASGSRRRAEEEPSGTRFSVSRATTKSAGQSAIARAVGPDTSVAGGAGAGGPRGRHVALLVDVRLKVEGGDHRLGLADRHLGAVDRLGHLGRVGRGANADLRGDQNLFRAE